MAVSQLNISPDTPMGANLAGGGATFRVWAPNALKVYVIFDFTTLPTSDPNDPTLLLSKGANGHWTGFFPGLKKGQLYMFYVIGPGGQSLKRDPYARALTADDNPLNWRCILESADFPWHDAGFVTPAYSDMVIYQLHVGTFYAPNLPLMGTFLDVAAKIPYLSSLGVTVIQLMPIHEFESSTSQGYNGADIFSPEMLYTVPDNGLAPYLGAVNGLLAAKELLPYTLNDISGGPAQLRALVDLCHCYGMAVIFDVVYNHGGPGFDSYCLSFMDMQDSAPGFINSLYFTATAYIGQVWDFSKPDVSDFLINNAKAFLSEYHGDGFRYDEISMLNACSNGDGWVFCQNLTSTMKFLKPEAVNHAEYWQGEFWINKTRVVAPVSNGGAGFDTTLCDSQRTSIRDVIGNAAQPDARPLDMQGLSQNLWQQGFVEEWQCVQGPENHDVVFNGKQQRMTAMSDPSNARSWYATSRSRVSMGITLTSPGIPMIFMGEEFLEDKQWCDDIFNFPQLLIYWGGLIGGDNKMKDFVQYTTDLIHLRWAYPALRDKGFGILHTDNNSRVMAFHRWVPDAGEDVVIVLSLAPYDQYNYQIGMPWGGVWKEAFNSDYYENLPNPNISGNDGQVYAENHPYDGSSYSALFTLPANGLLVFAR